MPVFNITMLSTYSKVFVGILVEITLSSSTVEGETPLFTVYTLGNCTVYLHVLKKYKNDLTVLF